MGWAGLGLLLLLALWLLSGILLPFVVGMAAAYILDPLADWLQRHGFRRGVATALLRESFALFATRGLKKAALGVDAQNRSGALKIYEQVGLHITLENMLFIRYLRGKPEDDPMG